MLLLLTEIGQGMLKEFQKVFSWRFHGCVQCVILKDSRIFLQDSVVHFFSSPKAQIGMLHHARQNAVTKDKGIVPKVFDHVGPRFHPYLMGKAIPMHPHQEVACFGNLDLFQPREFLHEQMFEMDLGMFTQCLDQKFMFELGHFTICFLTVDVASDKFGGVDTDQFSKRLRQGCRLGCRLHSIPDVEIPSFRRKLAVIRQFGMHLVCRLLVAFHAVNKEYRIDGFGHGVPISLSCGGVGDSHFSSVFPCGQDLPYPSLVKKPWKASGKGFMEASGKLIIVFQSLEGNDVRIRGCSQRQCCH